MKGSNKLTLNQDTMVEALQLWLDSKMVQQAPVVTQVKSDNNRDGTFEIYIDADADRPGPRLSEPAKT